ncbi:hypothetical protein [Nocardia cyriacigeorgica]|nr:hypothetical protein [Nocardia cyriacigeorgica]
METANADVPLRQTAAERRALPEGGGGPAGGGARPRRYQSSQARRAL